MVRWKNKCVNLVVRLKMLKGLTGLRLVISAVKRRENATAKTRTSITKREEKRGQKGANYAKNAGTKSNTKTGMPISIMPDIQTRS